MVNTVNDPHNLHADVVRDSSVVNNLMRRFDRVFPVGIVQGKAEHTTEYLEDGICQIMMMQNDYEALRTLFEMEALTLNIGYSLATLRHQPQSMMIVI